MADWFLRFFIIAFSALDRTVNIYDNTICEKIATLIGHNRGITDHDHRETSSDSMNNFLTISNDGATKLWDLRVVSII